VVFFQQGDFFNLFANDADMGLEQFGLKYHPKTDSVGVNRRDKEKWAMKFVNLGKRVFYVSQVSTATTDADKKKKSKAKKIAKRKTEERAITQVLTNGTLRDYELFADHNPNYFFAIMVRSYVFFLSYGHILGRE